MVQSERKYDRGIELDKDSWERMSFYDNKTAAEN